MIYTSLSVDGVVQLARRGASLGVQLQGVGEDSQLVL